MAGGLRASGPKADLALVVADGEAAAAGVFTTNIVCAAPVTYCRTVLAKRETVRAVRGPRAPAPLPQPAARRGQYTMYNTMLL